MYVSWVKNGGWGKGGGGGGSLKYSFFDNTVGRNLSNYSPLIFYTCINQLAHIFFFLRVGGRGKGERCPLLIN